MKSAEYSSVLQKVMMPWISDAHGEGQGRSFIFMRDNPRAQLISDNYVSKK